MNKLLEKALTHLKHEVSQSYEATSSSTNPTCPQTFKEDLHYGAEAYLAVRQFWRGLGNDCGNGFAKSAKAAARAVRDTVAWRCSALVGIANKPAYLNALDDAFRGQLSRSDDLRSQMLNAFHLVMNTEPDAFESKSSLNAQSHGRKRHRKREQRKPQELGESSAAGMDMPVKVGTVDRGLVDELASGSELAAVAIRLSGFGIASESNFGLGPWGSQIPGRARQCDSAANALRIDCDSDILLRRPPSRVDSSTSSTCESKLRF